MASKRQNMFYENKKQKRTEIVLLRSVQVGPNLRVCEQLVQNPRCHFRRALGRCLQNMLPDRTHAITTSSRDSAQSRGGFLVCSVVLGRCANSATDICYFLRGRSCISLLSLWVDIPCVGFDSGTGSLRLHPRTCSHCLRHQGSEDVCELLAGELCAHICVSSGSGSYVCRCRPGFFLMSDGKSCREEKTHIPGEVPR
ncbi:hypothetical protein AAG570_013279 [Ranatra chinensis]|uniref:EGF-like domain-containing protein n=1 Tax=Ranatra chinensis TaxID=642074 RepID=A0ABD0YGL1_9HEMI